MIAPKSVTIEIALVQHASGRWNHAARLKVAPGHTVDAVEVGQLLACSVLAVEKIVIQTAQEVFPNEPDSSLFHAGFTDAIDAKPGEGTSRVSWREA